MFGTLPPWAARIVVENETTDTTPEPVSVEPTPPAKNASNVAWVEYAIACGADPDEAASTSRADLIATYSPQEN